MDHDGLVTVEVRRAGVRREVEVGVADRPGRCGNVPVLPGQVASLAGFWRAGIAEGCFAPRGRVEVGEGAGAVAIGRDRFGVNVVD